MIGSGYLGFVIFQVKKRMKKMDAHVIDYHLRKARTLLAKAAGEVRKANGNYWERTEFSDVLEAGIGELCQEIKRRKV